MHTRYSSRLDFKARQKNEVKGQRPEKAIICMLLGGVECVVFGLKLRAYFRAKGLLFRESPNPGPRTHKLFFSVAVIRYIFPREQLEGRWGSKQTGRRAVATLFS